MFRFFVHGNPASDVAKGVATGRLFVGLLLIGFGLLVFILRDLFAFVAAAVFFLAGFTAIGYAIRLYLLQHKIKKSDTEYRKNVEIHYDDRLY